MKRTLRFWPLLATIYFCVSGGAFGLEPMVQAGAGLAVLLLIVTPIIWSAPVALLTAELGSAMPDEGGYYVWVKRALGQPCAFLCGWWTWIYSWVDTAIYPTLFAAYVARFLELVGYSTAIDSNPWTKWLVGLAIIVPLTWLNMRGTKIVGVGSVSFFVLLLVPFAVLLAFGMSKVVTDLSATVHPFVWQSQGATGAVGVGLFSVMWNYLGWDSISTVSGEIVEPQRNLPRALGVGVLIVTASYLFPVLVGLTVLRGTDAWKDGAWVQVASLVGGRWLGIAVAAAGIVSSAGLFSATLLSSSRIPFVLARDRWLPARLTKLHPKWGTPTVAILVSAVFYTALSYERFNDLTVVDVVLYSSALVFEFIALAVLRFKEPDLMRPFRIPGGWPALVLVLTAPAALVVFACISRFQDKGQVAIWLSAVALASGPVVWWIGRQTTKRSL
ncbi:MAG: APC family permease [Fimbriimonas sp.]|nr:APC family permease [Fimbriimonas sp.]